MGFGEFFDDHYISCELGARKIHDAYWKQTIASLQERLPGLMPRLVLFIDDMQENLDVARLHGLQTLRFEDSEQTRNVLLPAT
jgi:FMN phosphatase YigB (HAD superfamily)